MTTRYPAAAKAAPHATFVLQAFSSAGLSAAKLQALRRTAEVQNGVALAHSSTDRRGPRLERRHRARKWRTNGDENSNENALLTAAGTFAAVQCR